MTREFSRHNRGDFTPANCVRCQRTDDIIDLGANDLPAYGRVYLCSTCLAELAEAMDYVDASTHTGMLRAHQAETALYRGQYEKAVTQLRAAPDVIREKTERLGNGIRDLADDFARSIVSDASGDAGDAVPARAEDDALPDGGAVHVPVEAGGGERAAEPERAGLGGAGSGAEQDDAERGPHSNNLGTGPATEPTPEGDGPELDESFGWIEHVASSDGVDPAERDSAAGD